MSAEDETSIQQRDSLCEARYQAEIRRLRDALRCIADGAESNPAHEVAALARKALAK
jgi:hypothetical protein